MRENQDFPLQIRELLLTSPAMSLKQLGGNLNNRSRSSLFRDLNKLDVISSYTHTGQYHALSERVTFDEDGLWFYQDVGFSRVGTLKETLLQLISHAALGITHRKMKILLRVDIQKPLTDLINTQRITRQQLTNHIYVYLSADKNKAEEQFQQCLLLSDRTHKITLPPESIRIEILVEVIHSPDRSLDETVLGSLLRKRGLIIKDDEIAYVLAYYDIKKKQILK